MDNLRDVLMENVEMIEHALNMYAFYTRDEERSQKAAELVAAIRAQRMKAAEA